jgi:hypothetical protein
MLNERIYKLWLSLINAPIKARLMCRMEIEMPRVVEKDRIMWFFMWFLASVATFGIAFFPMFYFLIDRRNRHFQRRHNFEKQVATIPNSESQPTQTSNRNAKLWAASIILIVPVFVIAYFLSKDLLMHEKRQKAFLATISPNLNSVSESISIRNYVIITVATLGFGVIYWLYKLVNVYNNHFKEHQHIEAELGTLMEATSHGESM